MLGAALLVVVLLFWPDGHWPDSLNRGLCQYPCEIVAASPITAALVSLPADGSPCNAPCFVHFDTTGTTTTDADVRPFHDLFYEISYGDSGCASGTGTWSNSNAGAAKNRDTTPIGAHVYECAGAVTATLTVTDSAGNTDTAAISLTITSEDSEWPTTETTCVSTDAAWTGCPAGATQVTSADFDTALVKTAGARTLYECGETFVLDTNPNVADASANNSLIGGFGTCSGNPVLVTYAGTSDMLLDDDWDGWTIRDIRVTASAALETTGILQSSGVAPVVGFLALRFETLQFGECSWFPTNVDQVTWNEQIAYFSYTCSMTVHNETLGWPVRFMSVRNGAFVNDSLTGNVTSANWVRTMGLNKVLWAHATMSAATGTNLTNQFRSAQQSVGRDDKYVVISDWRLHDNGTEGTRTIALCWQHGCNTDATDDTDKSDYIIEGVRTTYGAAKTALVNQQFQLMANRVTVRNNITDMRSVTPATNVHMVITTTIGAGPVDIDVYNNTIVRAGSTAGTTSVCSLSQGSGHRCRNNLIYDVDDTDGTLTVGAAYEAGNPSNNIHLNGPEEGCPFAGSDGACTLTASGSGMDFNEFKIRASGGSRASVVDAGFDFPEATAGQKAEVYLDAFCGERGTAFGGGDGQWDIGAHEFGAAGTCS